MDRIFDTLFHSRSRRMPYYSGGGYGTGRVPSLEIMVPMCCGKCEEKLYEGMMELRGVQGVHVDRESQRVFVHGYVDQYKALRKAKRVKRDSQILQSGVPFGGDYLSSPKYRRSSYMSPSVYRSSALEYRPSAYQSSVYDGPSVYRSSHMRHTPSYGRDMVYGQAYGRPMYAPSYGMYNEWPMYDDMYSDSAMNPYYYQHPESEYY